MSNCFLVLFYQNWLLEKIAQIKFMTTTNFIAFANAQIFHPRLHAMDIIAIENGLIILVWKYQGRLEGNCNNCLGKEKLKVLILYLVNYFVSFSVLIYETQIPLMKRLFWQIPHKATWKANFITAKAERFFGKNAWL